MEASAAPYSESLGGSPHPSEASLAFRPPAPSVAEHTGRSRGVIVPLHLRGRRVCATPNGEMPRQLLRWFHHELAVAAIRGPIGDWLGWLLPRLM